MLVIASDGGLVVPALGPRWESRYTHRFAGPAANNGERLARLLELMRPHHGEDRRASWVEALAVADSGRVLASWELHGGVGYLDEQPPAEPLPEFWVFSVWRFPQFGATYSQLTDAQRESIYDHWGRLRRPRPPLPHINLRACPINRRSREGGIRAFPLQFSSASIVPRAIASSRPELLFC